MSKIAVITGVGSAKGTGAAIAKRFAEGGYTVAMLARNAERLQAHEGRFPNSRGFACDVANEAQLNAAIAEVKANLGTPMVLIHNAVGGTLGSFTDISPEDLLTNFKVNTMGLLYLARALASDMIKAGGGVMIATGNTSAFRGTANYTAFAPTKAAQRILAETLARDLGPKGIHVAYLMIDAVINVPWTRGMYPNEDDSFFIEPASIADEVWHITHQRRDAWAFNAEVRPYREKW